ncbi:MAG: hypothetical protein IJ563_09995 [Selenomonadaceae bacterium]|nr:hypothetical protein [Selenomonadaceae bacterium]
MTVNADDLNKIIETVKKFFHDLIKPDMTIEKLAEVASPKLDDIIKKNAEKGLKYSAGKFKIIYLDDEHFALEFEMYFKDEAGKWYKAANKSEPRNAELIEPGSWKTLKALKVVEFPIGAPNDAEMSAAESSTKADNKNTEAAYLTEAKDKNKSAASDDKVNSNSADNNDITLEKLMNSQKS